MSATGQPSKDLGQVIVDDLKAAGDWIVGEAASIGATMWSDIKWLFKYELHAQAQIAYNVLGRIEDDAIAGKSIEQIEADALNTAVGGELVALAQLGTGFQAIIAVYKHSVVSSRAPKTGG